MDKISVMKKLNKKNLILLSLPTFPLGYHLQPHTHIWENTRRAPSDPKQPHFNAEDWTETSCAIVLVPTQDGR